MSEGIRRAPRPRMRIPLWADYGQAERFAGVLGIAFMAGAIPYLLAERMLTVEVLAAVATALFGLCTWSARGGSRWVLGLGMPLTLTIGSLTLLYLSAGTGVASGAMLALVPPVAALWGGSQRVGWIFLATTLASSLALPHLLPVAPTDGAVPLYADARVLPLIAPLATGLFLVARSWAAAHGEWQQHVIAAHAVVAASEARFKAYIENAHDVTAEVDARGRILFLTARTEDRYALPVADLLGADGREYLHPDDLPAAHCAFAAAARGRATVSDPLRYRGAREGWRYLRLAVSSYRTQAGELRFVLQARDETAAALAQQSRERRIAELEAALARAEALLSQGAIARSGEVSLS